MGPNTANPQYLDVYMEGIAFGWMAIGFSDNQMMVRISARLNALLSILSMTEMTISICYFFTHIYIGCY